MTIYGSEVSKTEYDRQKPDRVLLADCEEEAGYIFRLKFLPQYAPLYAADIFVRLLTISSESTIPDYQLLTFDFEDSTWNRPPKWPFNRDGLAIAGARNDIAKANLSKLTEAGYLLSRAALDEVDMVLLASEPIPQPTPL